MSPARLVTRKATDVQVTTRTRTLKPIYDREFYHKALAKELESIWYHVMYKPVLDLLRGKDVRMNSKQALINALAKDRIQYQDGHFYGPFSASVSKGLREIGATWDRTRKAFALGLRQMPLDIREAIAQGTNRQKVLMHEIKLRIDAAEKVLMDFDYDFSKMFEGTIYDANNQFLQTVKGKMTVPPSMSKAAAEKLAKAYSENLKPYVKDWSQKAIATLRSQVTVNVVQGFRASRMVESIQSQAGVTKRKAEFLARQETSLLVSKFREERYKDVGLVEYEWSTGGDERVRKDHKELDGRIFRFDQPPVVDKATGRRANPGEDFNCRCIAIPVFREAKQRA